MSEQLSKQLTIWRAERPDEWRMDEFIKLSIKLEAENAALKAMVAELEAIGREMASDLESEICARYGINNAQLHPALEHKFKSDMEVVHRFRTKFDMDKDPANEA